MAGHWSCVLNDSGARTSQKKNIPWPADLPPSAGSGGWVSADLRCVQAHGALKDAAGNQRPEHFLNILLACMRPILPRLTSWAGAFQMGPLRRLKKHNRSARSLIIPQRLRTNTSKTPRALSRASSFSIHVHLFTSVQGHLLPRSIDPKDHRNDHRQLWQARLGILWDLVGSWLDKWSKAASGNKKPT